MAEWVGSAFASVKKRLWSLIELNRARAAAKGTVGGCGGQRRPWGCCGGVPDCGGGLIGVPVVLSVLSAAPFTFFWAESTHHNNRSSVIRAIG